VNGCLVPPGDAAAMAAAVTALLGDEALRRRLGAAAAERGRQFSLERQVDAFLDWYAEILGRKK
jgi:glycosyltransferase involved in cell wall biosynthesis